MVPTPAAPAFEASPELASFSSVGTSEAVSGLLAVSIHGCASIDGTRLLWPSGTSIDATGSVVLPDGRVHLNGQVVDLHAARVVAPPPNGDRWCRRDEVLYVDIDP